MVLRLCLWLGYWLILAPTGLFLRMIGCAPIQRVFRPSSDTVSYRRPLDRR